MRKFLIVFFTVFTLTMNYFATGLLAAAERDGVSAVSKAKDLLGQAKSANGLSAKEIKEIVFRSEKLADEFYRFRDGDKGDAIKEIVQKINSGSSLEEDYNNEAFPELIELELKEGEPVTVAGRLWVDDVFLFNNGKESTYFQSTELRSYFKAIMETKIPSISPEKVIIQQDGQKNEEVIGSFELENINDGINNIIKPLMTDADRTKLAWTPNDLQAILADPEVNYYDIYLPQTFFYNDLEADRIIVFQNGQQEGKVLFTNRDLSKGLVLNK